MVFLDRPVLDTGPDFTNIEAGQLDDFRFIEVAPGAGTPWKPTSKLRRDLRLPFLFGTKAEWRVFRDFFATLKGAQQGFWLPLWLTDYDSYENLQGGTAIKIRDINLAAAFVADEQFAFLALIDRTQLEPKEIANITILGGGDEQLNTTTTISGTFGLTDSVCCGMIFCRIAADPLRYQYLSDGCVRVTVEFEELPREYVTAHLGSNPVYLYEFVRGTLTWRMTNWPEPLVIDDECWSPDNIRHGSLLSGIDFLPEDMDLFVATEMNDHPLRYYKDRSAFLVTTLQIWETNAETFPFVRAAPLYKGRIGPVEFPGQGRIEARCSSIFQLAELQLPRKQQQRTCNHQLYDVNCTKSRGTYEVIGTLTAVTDDYVEAAAWAAEAITRGDPQWFALDKVVVGLETRMTVGQSAGKLYIDEPFQNAAVGQSAKAYPGCNKRVAHCDGKFENIDNMLAAPYAPNANPQFEHLLNPKVDGGKKA